MKYVYVKTAAGGERSVSKKFDSKTQAINDIELRYELSAQAVNRIRLYGKVSMAAYSLEITEATD